MGTAATGRLSTEIRAQLFAIFLVLLCAQALAQLIFPFPPPLLQGSGWKGEEDAVLFRAPTAVLPCLQGAWQQA